SAAAELAVPGRVELCARVDGLARRSLACWQRGQEARRTELRAAIRALPTAEELFALPRQRLDPASPPLPRALTPHPPTPHPPRPAPGKCENSSRPVLARRGPTRPANPARAREPLLRAGRGTRRAGKARGERRAAAAARAAGDRQRAPRRGLAGERRRPSQPH